MSINIFKNSDNDNDRKAKLEIITILKKYKVNDNVTESITNELLPLIIKDKRNEIKENIKNYLELFIPLCKNNKKYDFINKFSDSSQSNECKYFSTSKIFEMILSYNIDLPGAENVGTNGKNKKYFIKKSFLNFTIAVGDSAPGCSSSNYSPYPEQTIFPKQQLENYLENLGKMIREYGKEFYIKVNGYKKYGKYIALIFKHTEIFDIDELDEKYKTCNIVNKENTNGKICDMCFLDENVIFSEKYILNPFYLESVYFVSKRGRLYDHNNKKYFFEKTVSEGNIELSNDAKEGLRMINIIDPTELY